MGVTGDNATRLAELIRESGPVVALTGAGISVPSGIPDFRSPGTGLWTNVDPMEVAHIDAFHRDPERFWSFYSARFDALEDKQPNRAHEALAELERAGLLDAVITQNIDRLHAKAGTNNLVEVHGSIASSRCLACRASFPLEEVRRRQRGGSEGGGEREGSDGGPLRGGSGGVPRCDCGEPLKPGVVLFGEYLPPEEFARAERLAASAGLLLCIGSSLEVYPVARLPELTFAGGGRVAIVTQGSTPFDALASVRLRGDVVAELDAVLSALSL
jgi:NAD-dependent deacetylase